MGQLMAYCSWGHQSIIAYHSLKHKVFALLQGLWVGQVCRSLSLWTVCISMCFILDCMCTFFLMVEFYAMPATKYYRKKRLLFVEKFQNRSPGNTIPALVKKKANLRKKSKMKRG